jgi:hypothetical protein
LRRNFIDGVDSHRSDVPENGIYAALDRLEEKDFARFSTYAFVAKSIFGTEDIATQG